MELMVRFKTSVLSAVFTISILIGFGTWAFRLLEDWTWAESFYFSVATLTTVGYGDIYPITMLGKFISGIMALIGIGIVAIPTGLLSSAFVSEIEEKKKIKNGEKKCPHCDKSLEK